MWYKLSKKIFCTEEKHDLIINPESTPLPEGYYRAFHAVNERNIGEDKPFSDMNSLLQSIRQKGLLTNEAGGTTYGEPNMIWGTTGSWKNRYSKYKPTVEFRIPEEDLIYSFLPGRTHQDDWKSYFDNPHEVALMRSINPEDIIAVHHPWHETVRYIQNNPDAFETLQQFAADGTLEKPTMEKYRLAYEYFMQHPDQLREFHNIDDD